MLTVMRAAAQRVRESFVSSGFTVEGIAATLGPVASAALAREERVPVLNAFPDATQSPLATYVRLFVLGDSVVAHSDIPVDDLVGLGLASSNNLHLTPLLEVRPYGDDEHDFWVVSDLSHLTGRELAPDHVLGVGGASMTLAHLTPRTRVTSAADIGTGCGVQALHLATHVDRIVVTDISTRALHCAELSAALSDVEFERRQGSFLEPIAQESFDLVVSNPPFVISPRAVFEYRDGGLRADDVGRQLVRDLPQHLNDGGVAILLANWLHVRGQDWRERVHSWVSGLGVQAWIVQRDIQDPTQYVSTWLRDAAAERAQLHDHAYAEWLAEFEALDAEAVGFGWIVLRKNGRELVTIEDHVGASRLPTGDEVLASMDGFVALQDMDAFAVLNSAFTPAPGLSVRGSAHYADGVWLPGMSLVQQSKGWRAPVELDDLGVSLLRALDGRTPVGQVLDDLADQTGMDLDDVLAAGLLTVRALLGQGLVVPVIPAGI